MGIIAKYKFDGSVYADLLPEFNTEFTNYTITDETEGNIITRTIESESLPTLMRFGSNLDTYVEGNELALLEVLDMNTSELTNCYRMFRGCKNLADITCEWDTSNVINMSAMFADCNNLTTLDLSNFDTSNTTNMSYMFYNCRNLTTLDVSNFNTSNVTYTHYAFCDCTNLISLDVSNFDTSNVTSMSNMFSGCNNLASLDVSGFDTSKVVSMQSTFHGCYNLTSLDVSNFDTSNVTTMQSTFNSCINLTTLDVSNFNTSKVTNIQGAFYNCQNLTTLDVSNFDTSKVTNMQQMFAYCNKLTSLDVSNFNTSNVTNMSYMFRDCKNLTTLDVSNFNTSNVTNMSLTFYGCTNLTTLDASNWDTSNVTDFTYILVNTPLLQYIRCNNVSTINTLSTYLYDRASTTEGKIITTSSTNINTSALSALNWTVDTSGGIKIAEYKFNKSICNSLVPEFNSEFSGYFFNDVAENNIVTREIVGYSGLPTLMRFGSNLSAYVEGNELALLEVLAMNTSGLTSCHRMFRYCKNLTSISCEWDTSNVTNMYAVFSGCHNLTSLDVSNFDTSNATNMQNMFDSCNNLTTLDVSNFDTSKVTNMQSTFAYCHKLTSLDVSNWDTSKVTTMYGMFRDCNNLISLDVSNFDTSSVTNMQSTFHGCTNLTSLDVSNFDTSNVTTMYGMLRDCNNLISLDVSNFDTSNVTTMAYMFDGCNNLTTLDVSNFDTSNVTNFTSMLVNTPLLQYIRCNNVSTINTLSTYLYDRASTTEGKIITTSSTNINTDTLSVLNWTVDTSGGTMIAKYKFDKSIYNSLIPEFNSGFIGYFCNDVVENNIVTRGIVGYSGLPTLMRFGRLYVDGESTADNRTDSLLEVLDMNTSGLTSCHSMFRYCKNLTSITCEWDTSNVTNLDSMFYGCTNLTSLDVSNFDTSKVTIICYMFRDCNNLNSLDVSNWDTSKVTNMYGMFYNCQNLTSLDVSNFNTSKVNAMQSMFSNCYNLTSLDVSNFDTSNATNTNGMFYNCNKLTSLDVSNWNTSNVTNMGTMFQNCSNLTSLDVSNWNTSNVTNMGYMFYNCNNLTTLDAGSWDTSNVTNMYSMFYNCTNLTSLDVSNFDTSNVINMGGMFYYCESLTSLDVSNFNTSKVTNMDAMFTNCSNLTTLDVSNWNTSKVTTMGNMLTNTSSLQYIRCNNVSTINTLSTYLYNRASTTEGKIITTSSTNINTNALSALNWAVDTSGGIKIAEYKFNKSICNSLVPEFNSEFSGYFFNDVAENNIVTREIVGYSGLPTLMRFGSNLDTYVEGSEVALLEVLDMNTSGLTSCYRMFRYCKNLTGIACDWDTSKVTSMAHMFNNCKALTSLNASNFDTSKVSSMAYMFNNCYELTTLDVSNFNTSNVSNMIYMFSNCYELTSLDLSNFDTGKATSMSYMFQGCTNLTSLDVSNWDTSKVNTMQSIFHSCSNLTSLDAGSWDTSNVTNMQTMFYNCSNLTSLDAGTWNTSSVIYMHQMFYGCSNLTSLDAGSWDTSNVINMQQMFAYCNKLTTLDLSNFNTSKVTNTYNIFVNAFLLADIGMIYCDQSTINKIASVLPTDTNRTIWVESDDTSQYDQYSHIAYKTQMRKTFYLNSPLLEGDTIEDMNGVATHVKRYDKVVLDGSENWVRYAGGGQDNEESVVYSLSISGHSTSWETYIPISDRFVGTLGPDTYRGTISNSFYIDAVNIVIRIDRNKTATQDVNGFKQWLQANPTTVVYKLATPIYEPISDESILCNSYVNGYLDFDSTVPVEKVVFKPLELPLAYIPSGNVTLQYNSDKNGLVKQTLAEITNPLIIDGIGETISNIVVTEATDKEFEYFNGIQSTFEDKLLQNLVLDETLTPSDTRNLTVGVDTYETLYVDGSLRARSILIDIQPNTTYTTVFPEDCNVAIHEFDINNIFLEDSGWKNNVHSFTTSANSTKIVLYMRKTDNSYVRDYAKNCPFYLLKGDWTANPLTYEEVVNYEGKYKVEYKVTGENLASPDNWEMGSGVGSSALGIPYNQYKSTTNARCRFINPVKVKPNTTYSISSKTGSIAVLSMDKDTIVISDSSWLGHSIQFTTENNCEYIALIWSKVDSAFFTLDERDKTINIHESDKEYTKTFYLNSPLLEGDTIEDVNGVATHVKRYEKVVLDGSENWNYNSTLSNGDITTFRCEDYICAGSIDNIICDRFINSGATESNLGNELIRLVGSWSEHAGKIIVHIKTSKVTGSTIQQWLQANPVTVVYELTSPIREPISTESILCDSYVNGHLDFDSAVPVEKVVFNNVMVPLKYLTTPGTYTIQFESDNIGKLDLVGLGGNSVVNNVNVIKGINKFIVTSEFASSGNRITFYGIGFNASNIVVTEATDKEFEYFKGIQSTFESKLVTDENDENYGKYKVEYKVTGKNKFDKNKELQAINYRFENRNYQADFNDDYIRVKTGLYGSGIYLGNVGSFKRGTYIISCECYLETLNLNEINIGYFVNDNWKRKQAHTIVNFNTWEKFTYTFTLENDTDSLYLQLQATGSPSKYENLDFRVRNIQIEEGSVATEYEPYKECTKTVYLNSPLLKGDRLEVMDGKLYHWHKMGKVVFDGSEDTWDLWQASDGTKWYIYKDIVYTKNYVTTYPVKVITWNGTNRFSIISTASSIAEFKQWLQANPTTVVYELASPYYEEISDESLDLPTYNEVTHIELNSTVPYDISIFNKEYDILISPSTLYTVLVDKPSGNIEIDLGGTTGYITSNGVTITTPSTLVHERLKVYGKGISISNIRVLEGNHLDCPPSYFQGLQSSFECSLVTDENDPNYGKYKVEYKVTGKNKCIGVESGQYSSSAGEKLPHDTRTRTKELIMVKPGMTITVSGWTGATTGIFYMCTYDKNKNFIERRSVGLSYVTGIQTITIPNNTYYVAFTKDSCPYAGQLVQIEEGSVATEYEPYKESIKTFYLNSPLLEGDTIELVDGKLSHVHKMGMVVFNGSEGWFKSSVSGKQYQIYYTSVPNGKYSQDNTVSGGIVKSDRFPTKKTYNDMLDNEELGVAFGNSSLGISVSISELLDNTPSSLKQWLQVNPTTVVYELASPYYEDIEPLQDKTVLLSIKEGDLAINTLIPIVYDITYTTSISSVNALQSSLDETITTTRLLNDIADDITNN